MFLFIPLMSDFSQNHFKKLCRKTFDYLVHDVISIRIAWNFYLIQTLFLQNQSLNTTVAISYLLILKALFKAHCQVR